MVKYSINIIWNSFNKFKYLPLNIFSHGLGAIDWSIAGYMSKDKALMTNFGLQIPLFMIGYYNFFLL
jgi:hypothetical protein